MSRRERIDAMLEDFGKELEALRTEAMQEIRQAEREANGREARHHDATEELAQVEQQIAAYTAEREQLPIRATRAGMDEEYQLEDELKARYKNLRPAIEALEDRRGSLKEEIRRLLPRPQGHPNDARIHAMATVSRAAHGPRQDFEHLLKGLTDALLPSEDTAPLEAALQDASNAMQPQRVRVRNILAAADPIIREHVDRYAETAQLGNERSWDLSPVGRGALR